MFKSFLFATAILAITCFVARAQNLETVEKQAASPAQPASACQDDPRLEGDLLAIMQSDQPLNPPLTITPESFIGMNPEIIAKLGGQMVICPNNPVGKNGKPFKKVEVDFAPLWNAIQMALGTNDIEAVQYYARNFRARPMPTEEVVKLLTPVDINDKALDALSEALGWDFDKSKRRYVISAYALLGGKASDNTPIAIAANDFGKEDIDKLKKELNNRVFMIERIRSITGINSERDAEAKGRSLLNSAGVKVIN